MRRFLVCCCLLALAACYKIDIHQGNVFDQQALERLREGMSKRQVAALLGTPLINDPFHAQRWDYIYLYYPQADESEGERRRVTVYFQGDTVGRIVRDQSAAPARPEPEPVGAAAVLDQ